MDDASYIDDGYFEDSYREEETPRRRVPEWIPEFRRLFSEDISSQRDRFFDFIVDTIFDNKAVVDGFFDFGSPQNPDPFTFRYGGKDPVVVNKLFRAFIRRRLPAFVIDDNNEDVIRYLVNVYCNVSERRGVVIRGNVGSGKTLLVLLWIFFRRRVLTDERPGWGEIYGRSTRPTKVVFLDQLKIVSLFQKYQFELFNRRLGDVLVIDDVGIIGDVTHFGTRINLIENIIYRRYNDAKEDRSIETYLTTNLTSAKFCELFGDRVFSRVVELMAWNEGILVGDDRRLSAKSVTEWIFKTDFYDPFNPQGGWVQ